MENFPPKIKSVTIKQFREIKILEMEIRGRSFVARDLTLLSINQIYRISGWRGTMVQTDTLSDPCHLQWSSMAAMSEVCHYIIFMARPPPDLF